MKKKIIYSPSCCKLFQTFSSNFKCETQKEIFSRVSASFFPHPLSLYSLNEMQFGHSAKYLLLHTIKSYKFGEIWCVNVDRFFSFFFWGGGYCWPYLMQALLYIHNDIFVKLELCEKKQTKKTTSRLLM